MIRHIGINYIKILIKVLIKVYENVKDCFWIIYYFYILYILNFVYIKKTYEYNSSILNMTGNKQIK